MSKLNFHRNLQKGIDLSFTDKDSVVKVETGNRDESLDFWRRLQTMANKAVSDLSKKPAKVHVVMINDGKIKRKSY